MTEVATNEPWTRWAANAGLRLHFLDSAASSGEVPVVFVPGFGEEAEEHRPFMRAMQPRRCVVADLRGRGRSDVPGPGSYALDEHVADLDAIITAAGLSRLHLVAYSRGTTYAMAWALRQPERVASLVIGDYRAGQLVPPISWAEQVARRNWRGRPVSERMSAPAITAMVAEATSIEYWDELARLACAVLLVRGGTKEALVTEEVEERYRQALPHIEVECFEASGHDLWSPDPDRFSTTVRAFHDRLDGPSAQYQ